jgi:hypothetical protein
MKWIEIKEIKPLKERKTKTFKVTAKQDGATLGFISWAGRWRKYVFEPVECTMFEWDCLRDIADFLYNETKEYKKNWYKP